MALDIGNCTTSQLKHGWGMKCQKGTYWITVKRRKLSIKSTCRTPLHILPTTTRLIDRDGSDICNNSLGGGSRWVKNGSVPIPTYSRILALLHFSKSPPLPHPISKTFPREGGSLPRDGGPTIIDERKAGAAYLAIKTDLIQLLNRLRPMIGDAWRSCTPTSLRALSVDCVQMSIFLVMCGR